MAKGIQTGDPDNCHPALFLGSGLTGLTRRMGERERENL
jgi:hypothetical protein